MFNSTKVVFLCRFTASEGKVSTLAVLLYFFHGRKVFFYILKLGVAANSPNASGCPNFAVDKPTISV
jgi:hypothetical protein